MRIPFLSIPVIFILAVVSVLPLPPARADSQRSINRIEDLTHKDQNIGTYRALIIGINDYQDDQIPDLETAKNDALAMADLLKTRYGFKIDSKDILLDRQATGEKIDKALRRFAVSTSPPDSVLIYYAGHGGEDRDYDDGWWIPTDAKIGKPRTFIDNGQIQKAMKRMPARHVLLISDSCYSGTLFGKRRGLPEEITEKYYLKMFNEKSRWGMTSGNKTPVSDDGTDGHSVFAYQLLKELRDNDKPYVSTQEIYTRIAPIIGNNSEQMPVCDPIRNTGDQGGQFIFLLASSGAEVDVPARPTQRSKTLLSVTANIADAKVYVDGQYMGSTHLTDKEITPGRHQIRVEKEGYQPYARELTFKQGREKSLQAILDPQTPAAGSLSIRTDPSGAAVRILNIDPTFTQGMELPPGRYHVEVSANGHATRRQWIELSSGEDKELDIRLEPTASASSVNNNVSPAQSSPPSPSYDSASGKSFTNNLGMEFVYIPAGTFMMGSPKGFFKGEEGRYDDEIQHEVTLTKGYYLQTTEVTQGQWQAVMGNNPSSFKDCGENCPVENVSWEDIQEFIKKLNQRDSTYQYRLPTEAEWEYAARAGTTTPFSFGETLSTDQANYVGKGPKDVYRGKTTPVKSFPANAWGLFDMHGNVWEWCQDRYGNYPNGSVTDPKGPSSGALRVLRGGSWGDVPRGCRSADRYGHDPAYRGISGGFRLAAPLFSR